MNLRLETYMLSKSYGGKSVLGGCTQSFGGDVTAIMGPNGCGKSTFLRICALLEEPTGGVIRYLDGRGEPLAHDIALRRRVTLVLPEGGIFDRSVWHNASYPLRVRGMGGREVMARTAQALGAVGLLGRDGQRATTLSSGEARRLALARALVLEPEALFLDEPTANVDEENRLIIENIVINLRASPLRPTILIATHDRAQAQRLADRILLMRSGALTPERGLGG